MLGFLKRKSNDSQTGAEPETMAIDTAKPNVFTRLKKGLMKTRHALSDNIASLFLGKKTIDQATLEELEALLLTSDVGVTVTQEIISYLTESLKRNQLQDATLVWEELKNYLEQILVPVEKPLIASATDKPYVILLVGINGAGKTTTIGKLAKHLQNEGKKVMLAAGDTFRAAAVEQLQVWGERNDIPVIAQASGADSAAVVFDALQAAKARGVDVLIADTAGRLHTKDNLMAELQKIKRVLGKLDPNAPHEVMLVLDASLGQNALIQARQFLQAVGVTGITLTKLDGTAKGGIIFAISRELKLPIRFIGVGEQIDDLRTFSAKDFINALMDKE